jgi:anti-sigma-K factor RskA
VDHGFRGLVRGWERRFGELHLMVEPVDADPRIWQRIKGKLSDAPATPSVVRAESTTNVVRPEVVPPQVAAPPAAAPSVVAPPVAPAMAEAPPPLPSEADIKPEPKSDVKPDAVLAAEQRLVELINEVDKFSEKRKPVDPSELAVAAALADAPPMQAAAEEAREPERVSREAAPSLLLPVPVETRPAVRERTPKVGRWRFATLMMALIAVGLGGLIAAWRFVPDRLPQQLRPAEVLKISGMQTPERKPAPHGTQFEE